MLTIELINELKAIIPAIEKIPFKFDTSVVRIATAAAQLMHITEEMIRKDPVSMMPVNFGSCTIEDVIYDFGYGVHLPSNMQDINDSIPVEAIDHLRNMIVERIGYVTEELLYKFIILHEVGHMMDLLRQTDHDVYISEVQKEQDLYQDLFQNLSSSEIIIAYRNIPSEKVADNYALSILSVLYSRELALV